MMRMHADALLGLRRLYGPEFTIWVYSNGTGSHHLWARPEADTPPETHRDHKDHYLVGSLDLNTGHVIPLGQEGEVGEDEAYELEERRTLWWYAEKFAMLMLAAAGATIAFIMVLCEAVGTGRRR
jgi:hypothetical protein